MIESVRFAGVGTFHVDDFDDFARQPADEALAAGFDHDGVAGSEQAARRADRCLPAAEVRRRSAPPEGMVAVGAGRFRHAASEFIDARGHLRDAHFRSAVKRVGGVAPGAAQIASGEAHKDAGQACAGAFALNRFEDFSDEHGVRECLLRAIRTEIGIASRYWSILLVRALSAYVRVGIGFCFSRVSAAQPEDGAEKESDRDEESEIAGGKSQVAQGDDVAQRDQHHGNHNQEKCAIHKSTWRGDTAPCWCPSPTELRP